MNCGLDLARVQRAIENPELDCALREKCVQVANGVSAVVVVTIGSAGLAVVPNFFDGFERIGLLFVELGDDSLVRRAAVIFATRVNVQGLIEQIFASSDEVDQVAQSLGRESVRADVYVQAATFVDESAGLAKCPNNLLQGFDVAVIEDRRHQFAFVAVGFALNNPGRSLALREDATKILQTCYNCDGDDYGRVQDNESSQREGLYWADVQID